MSVRNKPPCKDWDGVKHLRYAHGKMDGHFTRVIKDQYGVVTAKTSRDNDITHVFKKTREYASVLQLVPNGVTLLGELWTPGKSASYVSSIESQGNTTFTPFAIEQAPNVDRAALHFWSLDYVHDLVQCWGLTPPPLLCLSSDRLDAESLLAWSTGHALEGVVLKNANLADWYRYKPVKSCDAYVIGYVAGEGKYEGMVGSITFGILHFDCKQDRWVTVELGSCSGMTDEERAEWTEHQEEWMHTVIEVQYQEVGAGGRLRFPQYLRRRTDKLWHECKGI